MLKPTYLWMFLAATSVGSSTSHALRDLNTQDWTSFWIYVGLGLVAFLVYIALEKDHEKKYDTWVRNGRP